MIDQGASRIRLAELIAALSLATDLGMGQPMEQALRTCLLSVEAGRALGVEGEALSDVYYLALLRFVGCTADAHEQATAAGGDETALRALLAPVLMGDAPELMGQVLRHFAEGTSPLIRLRLLVGFLAEGKRGAKRTVALHCQVAQMLAARMGLRASIGEGVGQVFERWDGKGIPGELAGPAIPLPARIVTVARDVEIFCRMGGWDLATEVLRRRRAKAYDPAVVGVFVEHGARWTAELDERSAWEAVLDAEPGPQETVGPSRLDDVLRAFAEFTDLKSPFMAGHSAGVAELAEAAARSAGLPESEANDVRRAGLVHDLGRAGIANGIWDKPAALSHTERERVRLHPYLTERMLSHAAALRRLAVLAGAHHERLDGSGYHRGSTAQTLPMSARILAAADACHAMTEPRPYRPALDTATVATELRREVTEGRLDHDAVRAVLEAAGHLTAPSHRVWPAHLTDREVEVLRLISRGASNRTVAQELTISPKTAGRHVENIYDKLGVSSRAAAALFAMQHNLL
jgi:HD-GYP domain-containing protein (c-di-GMP phosphodiesterase class II)